MMPRRTAVKTPRYVSWMPTSSITTIENLWPEHKSIKAERPDLEYKVYQDLAKGRIKQQKAINIIYTEKTSYGKRPFDTDCN